MSRGEVSIATLGGLKLGRHYEIDRALSNLLDARPSLWRIIDSPASYMLAYTCAVRSRGSPDATL